MNSTLNRKNARINPYIAGKSLSDKDPFFGRTELLKDVINSLESPTITGITLYGQRRIGKTSILRRLEYKITSEYSERLVAVYCNLESFAKTGLNEVLENLAENIALKLGLNDLEWPKFDKNGKYFHETFLPMIFRYIGSGKLLVLLFDEFDAPDGESRMDTSIETAGSEFYIYLNDLLNRENQLRFVFVIGRRSEDLSLLAQPALRIAKNRSVGFLDPIDAKELILQAQRNGSLQFNQDSIDLILHLTAGHPYLTQLLCFEIFNMAYIDNKEGIPYIQPDKVNQAVGKAIDSGENILSDAWKTLTPIERIIISAIAEYTRDDISINRTVLYDKLLRDSAIIALSDIDQTPNRLVDWGLLQHHENGYQITVKLFQYWILKQRPLYSVLESEADRINPQANNLFLTANTFYREKNFEVAISQLNLALKLNRRHLQARILLSQIYSEIDMISKAVDELKIAYNTHQSARPYLVEMLVEKAHRCMVSGDGDEAYETYKEILLITPNHMKALEMVNFIEKFISEGDNALSLGDEKSAYYYYDKIHSHKKIKNVREIVINKRISLAKIAHDKHDWDIAKEHYNWLRENDGDKANVWTKKMQDCDVNQRLELAMSYEREFNWMKAHDVYKGINSSDIALKRAEVCSVFMYSPIPINKIEPLLDFFNPGEMNLVIRELSKDIIAFDRLDMLVKVVNKYNSRNLSEMVIDETISADIEELYVKIERNELNGVDISHDLTELVMKYPLYKDSLKRLYNLRKKENIKLGELQPEEEQPLDLYTYRNPVMWAIGGFLLFLLGLIGLYVGIKWILVFIFGSIILSGSIILIKERTKISFKSTFLIVALIMLFLYMALKFGITLTVAGALALCLMAPGLIIIILIISYHISKS